MRIIRTVAVATSALAFAGASMGASSCADSAEQLEDVSGDNDSNYRAQMKQVKLGMSKDDVRSIMGSPPRDKQRMKSEYGTTEMWYYGSWQLSFTDGVLDSKNKY
jgi:outer membrane protein assembly factor BamE (lipoprotein component of BamABCDE complex)